MSTRFETHGDFSWCELMTTDVDAAKVFYGGVFGWQFDDESVTDHPYTVLKAGESGVGGMMGMPPAAPGEMPPNWLCYVTVDDIDAVVARVGELGGEVCHGPMDVPGIGRFAVIQDPQGAVLAAIQYAARSE